MDVLLVTEQNQWMIIKWLHHADNRNASSSSSRMLQQLVQQLATWPSWRQRRQQQQQQKHVNAYA
jgi:hypothetical protein